MSTSADPPANPPPAASAGRRHPLLVRTLLLLTVVTGIVDAVSYLVLGHVFVANMTGNVVFLGFAFAGAPGLSIAASLVALSAFLAGAVIGGRLGIWLHEHRGRMLAAGVATTTVLVALAFLVSASVDRPVSQGARYTLIVVLALGMGAQNATSRRLAVADATTTVLTQTLVGLAVDSRLAGGSNAPPWRRIGSVLTMFTGALIGGIIVRHLDLRAALAVALGLLVFAATLIGPRSRQTPAVEWSPPAG